MLGICICIIIASIIIYAGLYDIALAVNTKIFDKKDEKK